MKRNILLLSLIIILVALTFGSVFQLVTEKNLEGIKAAVQSGEDIDAVNEYDQKNQTPLLRAISYGYMDPAYVEIAKYLIEQGAQLAHQDSDGFTALHYAAKNGHLEVVKMLVERGADLNVYPDESKFYRGETPLNSACSYSNANDKNLEVVQYLVEKGASMEKISFCFQSPLTNCMNSKAPLTAQYLLEMGADPNIPNDNGQTPLYLAIDKGLGNALIKELLKAGADPNNGSPYYTPLEMAIKKRDIELAQMLMAAGANIKHVDEDGNTLFHTAATINSNKNIDFLLSKGLDINAKNNEGQTPLHIAAEREYDSIVEQLINNGADLFALDNNQYMPMHIHVFVYKSDEEKVGWLLSKGVDVNMNHIEGALAPIHIASGYGDYDMVKFLHENGADLNIRADGGLTAIHAAAGRRGKVAVIDYLINHGVNVDVSSDDGYTPLFEAVMSFSEPEITLFLLEKGANINARDMTGKTIAHYAAQEKWDGIELLEFLNEYGADFNITDNDGKKPEFYAASDEIKSYFESLK
ncbi:MAG TPA: ankyrin repeat domain-containing protein [Thermotogota bacterium]|nr:ankyrin repeat domain-containing protein [Thermotogota bacterium]